MNKIKNLTVVFVAFITIILSIFIGLLTSESKSASALTDGCDEISQTSNNEGLENLGNEQVSTRGLFTSLSISINGGEGKVWGTVKNDVTIFPSTVIVIVELYSSTTYEESHLNMQLEARVYTEDLNMGKTITATSTTGGVQKYWHARSRYKVDNGAWKELSTGTCKIGPNGEYLGII